MAKARRRRIWSGSRDCLANVRRAAASKSGRRGTGAAMTILEQTWPPRNHTHAPRTTPAHESHFRGVGIIRLAPRTREVLRFHCDEPFAAWSRSNKDRKDGGTGGGAGGRVDMSIGPT